MATKPLILLVHGIGVHPQDAFKKDFISAMNEALKRFAINQSVEEYADIQEFNYDGFFDTIRKQLAQNAATYNDALNALKGAALLANSAVSLVNSVNAFQQSFGNDAFVSTHVLDAIFYGTYLGEKVRIDLAKKLCAAIVENVHRPKHFITHSLGTAVLHDTLAKLYRWEFDATDDIPDLHPVTHKLDSIFMVANVSRVIDKTTGVADPDTSLIRGGPKGCADYFYNIRHRLDPVTWPLRYEAHNSDADFTIVTNEIRQPNTHDFAEYITNPKVAVRIARRILDLDITDKAYAKAEQEFAKTTIGGGGLAGIGDADGGLREKLAGLDAKKIAGKLDSFAGLLEAIKTLQAILHP